jgi:16S rRNA (cytosine1402-N4)-methyltransferase
MMDLDLTSKTDHVPVLIGPIIENISPVTGVWVDATFGAGGYTRALLDAGAEFVFAIDRDPNVFSLAEQWLNEYPGRIEFVNDVFSNLENYVDYVNGVVFDLGVSSMQLDQATRGFSFLKEGPLDMRMSQTGPTAADLINSASEKMLSNILYFFGEERASRRIAKAIVARRDQEPFGTTTDLAKIIESVLPRSKPGQSHPATRSFQALRIAVNKEYEELFNGLFSAEKVLSADGCLVVVTFHSIEDRIVKRFIQARSGTLYSISRYSPYTDALPIQFTKVTQKAIKPSTSEISKNTRARSAKLRIAKRTNIKPGKNLTLEELSVPIVGKN